MQLNFQDLENSKFKAATVWLLWGSEQVTIDQSMQILRQHYVGYERLYYEADAKFNWSVIQDALQGNDLFSQQKIIEVRLAEGKVGQGSKAILSMVEHLSTDKILVLLAPQTPATWIKKTVWAQKN